MREYEPAYLKIQDFIQDNDQKDVKYLYYGDKQYQQWKHDMICTKIGSNYETNGSDKNANYGRDVTPLIASNVDIINERYSAEFRETPELHFMTVDTPFTANNRRNNAYQNLESNTLFPVYRNKLSSYRIRVRNNDAIPDVNELKLDINDLPNNRVRTYYENDNRLIDRPQFGTGFGTPTFTNWHGYKLIAHGLPMNIYEELLLTTEFTPEHKFCAAITPHDLTHFKSETPALDSPIWDCASADPKSTQYTKSDPSLPPSIEEMNIKAQNMASFHEFYNIIANGDYDKPDNILKEIASFIAPETLNGEPLLALTLSTFATRSLYCRTMSEVGQTTLFRCTVDILNKSRKFALTKALALEGHAGNFSFEANSNGNSYTAMLNPIHGTRIPMISYTEYAEGAHVYLDFDVTAINKDVSPQDDMDEFIESMGDPDLWAACVVPRLTLIKNNNCIHPSSIQSIFGQHNVTEDDEFTIDIEFGAMKTVVNLNSIMDGHIEAFSARRANAITILTVSKPSQVIENIDLGELIGSSTDDIVCAFTTKHSRNIFDLAEASRNVQEYEIPMPFDRRYQIPYESNYNFPPSVLTYWYNKAQYNMCTSQMPMQKGVIPSLSHETTYSQNEKVCFMTNTTISHINHSFETRLTSKKGGARMTHYRVQFDRLPRENVFSAPSGFKIFRRDGSIVPSWNRGIAPKHEDIYKSSVIGNEPDIMIRDLQIGEYVPSKRLFNSNKSNCVWTRPNCDRNNNSIVQVVEEDIMDYDENLANKPLLLNDDYKSYQEGVTKIGPNHYVTHYRFPPKSAIVGKTSKALSDKIITRIRHKVWNKAMRAEQTDQNKYISKVAKLNPINEWLKNDDPVTPINRSTLRNIELVQNVKIDNLAIKEQIHCFPKDMYEAVHKDKRGTETFESSKKNYIGPERGLTEDLWIEKDQPDDELLKQEEETIIFPEKPPYGNDMVQDFRKYGDQAIRRWILSKVKRGTNGECVQTAKRSGNIKEDFNYNFDQDNDDDVELKDNDSESDDDDDDYQVEQDVEMIISGIEQID